MMILFYGWPLWIKFWVLLDENGDHWWSTFSAKHLTLALKLLLDSVFKLSQLWPRGIMHMETQKTFTQMHTLFKENLKEYFDPTCHINLGPTARQPLLFSTVYQRTAQDILVIYYYYVWLARCILSFSLPLTLARTYTTNALQLEITPLTVAVLHPQFNQPPNEH